MTVETIVQDIGYAARSLRKKPGFTLAVVLTLALGLGANASMFGIVDRLLFRPPYLLRDPSRVNRVYLLRTINGKERPQSEFPYTRYHDLQRWTSSFDATAAWGDEEDVPIDVGVNARKARVGIASASLWSFFDLHPAVGRLFTAAEDTTPAGAPVAVLGYAYWQARYEGRADVLGQRLKVGDLDCTIIGVAPRGFTGPGSGAAPAVWVPVTTFGGSQLRSLSPKDPDNWFQKYNFSWIEMIARRKPGISADAATTDLTQAFKRSYAYQVEIQPRTTRADIARPRALAGPILSSRGPEEGQVSRVARWVGAVALAVLLIATVNVANLLLTRALRRRRETAVRVALGISRSRLVLQLLAESVLLGLGGGIVGLIMAQWTGPILRAQFFQIGDTSTTITDSRTLWFAGSAALIVGLAAGTLPALRSGRDIASALKTGQREGGGRRSGLRTALLMVQGILSVVLLIGAGLFVRSLLNVRSLRLGFDIDSLLWVSVDERGENGATAGGAVSESGSSLNFSQPQAMKALRERLLSRAKTLPGVIDAARAMSVPFVTQWDSPLFVNGIDSATMRELGPYYLQAASPEYLHTMGTRLLRGRFLVASDTKDAPGVMVVSEAMAKTVWRGGEALGQCVRVGADTAPCITVVGIAENVRSNDLKEDKLLYYYRPIEQAGTRAGDLFVRVRGPAGQSAEGVRRALQALMPGASYVAVQPFSDLFDPNIQSWKLGATMFVAFGGLALVLAAIGLYSIVAYNVEQRTHELGVRMAIGAQIRDLVRLVLVEGVKVAVASILLGSVVALYAGRWIAPLLFNERPTDWSVFAIVSAALLVASLLACAAPAWRAANVDPNEALRAD